MSIYPEIVQVSFKSVGSIHEISSGSLNYVYESPFPAFSVNFGVLVQKNQTHLILEENSRIRTNGRTRYLAYIIE